MQACGCEPHFLSRRVPRCVPCPMYRALLLWKREADRPAGFAAVATARGPGPRLRGLLSGARKVKAGGSGGAPRCICPDLCPELYSVLEYPDIRRLLDRLQGALLYFFREDHPGDPLPLRGSPEPDRALREGGSSGKPLFRTCDAGPSGGLSPRSPCPRGRISGSFRRDKAKGTR